MRMMKVRISMGKSLTSNSPPLVENGGGISRGTLLLFSLFQKSLLESIQS